MGALSPRRALALLALLAGSVAPLPAAGQGAPAGAPPAGASPQAPASASAPPAAAAPFEPLDPEAATEAYLERLPAAQRAKSDAYFEGGYWLQLWSFLYGLGVAWVLLASRLSARMRDLAARLTRFSPLRTFFYAVQYVIATVALTFPLLLYKGYFREHRYGLSNLTFGGWLGDLAKGAALATVVGALAAVLFYGVVRRAPRTWWLWGSGVALLFLIAGLALEPVFLAPIFNHYTEVRDPVLAEPILTLARANGIPADHVYTFDASRQSKRVSANVSGILGTTRISLNDNLLRRTPPSGILAVMGHEMGHYVLHHVEKSIWALGVLLVVGFAFVRWGVERLLPRWGARFGIAGVADPAGLPLLFALFTVYAFVLTPVFNTIVRTQEAEADYYGVNASRQPDGFAEVALQLSEYRKLAPGPIEEAIFFDHPSGRNRILMAMRWKAAWATGKIAVGAAGGTPRVP